MKNPFRTLALTTALPLSSMPSAAVYVAPEGKSECIAPVQPGGWDFTAEGDVDEVRWADSLGLVK